jgi:hypothetical protein
MTTDLVNVFSSSITEVYEYIKSLYYVLIPIGLTIFGILFIWLIAVKFFKRLAGYKDESSKEDDLSRMEDMIEDLDDDDKD